ncbi:MAG: PEP-CTERM sorting domain-containing protein [Sedimentisphaerales bacterium]|nr:PEP-CTERM sorting domain-containing protein [Sedimentisphaerales bacterium]
MRKSQLFLFALTAMVLLAITSNVNATLVFSNYSETSDNCDAWNDTANPVEVVEDFVAEDNTLGKWEISSITVNGYGGGIMGGAGPANINIYVDQAGSVGDLLIKLSNVSLTGSACGQDNTFAVTGLTITAESTYWLGIEALGGSSNAVGWRRTSSNSTGPTGTGYQQDGNGHIFKLEGTEIPEPATICLLGLGGLALLRKRRA